MTIPYPHTPTRASVLDSIPYRHLTNRVNPGWMKEVSDLHLTPCFRMSACSTAAFGPSGHWREHRSGKGGSSLRLTAPLWRRWVLIPVPTPAKLGIPQSASLG